MTYCYNNADTLVKLQADVHFHVAADKIVQGAYWDRGRGCFIGCLVHGSSKRAVYARIGFPVILTSLCESIFEGLPKDKVPAFFEAATLAPRLGADLSLVSWKFLHWLISEELPAPKETEKVSRDLVIEVLQKKAKGLLVSQDELNDAVDAAAAARGVGDAAAARWAVDAAARGVVDAAARWAAVDAAARWAAVATARAAAAVDAAAAAAAAAVDADAVDADARVRQAKKMIELLSNAGLTVAQA